MDAPLGSARVADNIMVTDRGGIGPRPGTLLVGTHDSGSTGVDGFHNFLRAFGDADQEIPVKASNGILKYLHPTLQDWFQLMGGYTPGSEFGFAESYGALTDLTDYLYFCNRTELYSRWSGATAVTAVQLNPADTTLTVDATLTPHVYAAGVVTALSAAGTVSSYGADSESNPVIAAVASLGYASQWANFYLTMTSGACSGISSRLIPGPTDSAEVVTLATAITSGSDHPANGDTFTITGNQAGYFVDTNAAFTPSQWTNFYLCFTSGVNAGLVAAVEASYGGLGASPALGIQPGDYGSAFLYPQLSELPAPGDTYELRMLAFPTAGSLTVATGTVGTVAPYGGVTPPYSLEESGAGTFTRIEAVVVGSGSSIGIPAFTGGSDASYVSATLGLRWAKFSGNPQTSMSFLLTADVLERGYVDLYAFNGASMVDSLRLYWDPVTGWDSTSAAIVNPAAQYAADTAGSGTYAAASSVPYSAVYSATQFTVPAWGGAAVPSGSAVAIQPTTYPLNPQGNRLQAYAGRMFVGNVVSTTVTDASSVIHGVPETSIVQYSKYGDAADFGYSATDPASTDGGFIRIPFGGGSVTDVAAYEGSVAVFKRYYVELDTMGTTDNVVTQVPLKQDFGSVNLAVKGIDDLYFVTADGQLTSVSRVALKDTVPQTLNMGLIIKRLLDTFDFSEVVGCEYEQRVLFACKRNASSPGNDQVIVYNKANKAFDGIWYLGASHFDIVDGALWAADPRTPNVVQLFTSDHNDTRTPAARWGIDCSWRSNWIHIVPRRSRFRVKPSQFAIQGINTIGFQGYIVDGSVITFSVFADFSNTTVLSFDFGILPTDDRYLHGADLSAFMGANPLGLSPLGTISDPNPDGERQFRFIVYFPDVYCNYLSMGVDSHGADTSWEVTRFGLGTEEDAAQADENIKSI